jgi:formylglycine-generating enzyme
MLAAMKFATRATLASIVLIGSVTGCRSAAVTPDDMAVIPAGHFTMGSTAAETAREKAPADFAALERPRHEVTIASFLLARHDVTRGEFAAFVAQTGYSLTGCNVWDGVAWKKSATANWHSPGFAQTDRHPVVCVSLDDIAAYIRWYSQKTGHSYRLASEAEWEYAARAGTTTARYWGDDAARQCSYGNGSERAYSRTFPKEPDVERACSDGYVFTSPVGSFRPNAWGLYDMLGDVWQWTPDCLHFNYAGAPADGSAWATGHCGTHLIRGGSWYDGPWLLRSAARNGRHPAERYNGVGFRLASSLPSP